MNRQMSVFYPTWFLPEGTPLECLLTVAEAGFDGASYLIGTLDDARRLDRLSAVDARELTDAFRRLEADRSLHISSDMYLKAEASDEAALQWMRGHIEAAVAAVSADGLPPVNLTLDPPVRWEGGKPQFLRDMTVELLGFMASLDERYGVRAAVENWPFPFLGTPEVLSGLVEDSGGGVGVLLDTGHAHIALTQGWCRQGSMAGFVGALPVAIVEVHCHDNFGADDEHLPPGTGTAHIAGAIGALAERGFDGPVTLECNLSAPGRSGLAEGLAAFRTGYLGN